ncbi:MAG: uncharacterized protein A8A55_1925 [Amphiamblys sp. WSBS2006]|nr:MAG: uncharacterized protein A8A55_1925 [Amphiamblys sp. WSBS2006]
MARNSPFCLERSGAMSSLALENVERMPLSSIGCVLKKIVLHDTGLINILPRLRIHEDKVIEKIYLSASEEEHVAETLKQGKTLFVGGSEEHGAPGLCSGYPRVHEDCEIEWLKLSASKKEHVAGIHKKDQTFCVGRVKNMWLRGYSAGILPKIKIHEDCEVENSVYIQMRKNMLHQYSQKINRFVSEE